jgi:hypothetical protein
VPKEETKEHFHPNDSGTARDQSDDIYNGSSAEEDGSSMNRKRLNP